jgi:Tol biopolymer transport system component
MPARRRLRLRARHRAALLGGVLALVSAPAAGAALIAYETTDGVSLVNTGGANARLIAGTESFAPAWSPDGTRLLYTRWDGLWMTRPDGSRARRIVRPRDPDRSLNDGAAAWSPTGRQIAFQATRVFDDPDASEGEGRAESIWTARSNGSGARRLRDGQDPAWIAGGRRIAFTKSSGDLQTNRIVSMRADGSGLRVLVGDARGLRFALAAAPRGRRLLFLEYPVDGLGPSIRVLNLRTGKVRTVSSAKTGPVTAATWSPNGTRIAFTPGPLSLPEATSIYTIKPDGTGRRPLFAMPPGFAATRLSWQPDVAAAARTP